MKFARSLRSTPATCVAAVMGLFGASSTAAAGLEGAVPAPTNGPPTQIGANISLLADCLNVHVDGPVVAFGVVGATGYGYCYDNVGISDAFVVNTILWDLESDGQYHKVVAAGTFAYCGPIFSNEACNFNVGVHTGLYPPPGWYHAQIIIANQDGQRWSANSPGSVYVK